MQENLELVVRAATDDRRARAERLAEVWEIFPRLAERRDQRAGTLSGGEQQMLALSRAFLSSARVLLMDEISMGLAPVLVESLYEAVQKLRDRGKTIVLVEQFLTYALRFADICYVLGKGRITFVGDAGELRSGAGADSLAYRSRGRTPVRAHRSGESPRRGNHLHHPQNERDPSRG